MLEKVNRNQQSSLYGKKRKGKDTMRKNLMKRLIVFFTVITVLFAGTGVYAAESYTVESGDYLKKIAQKVYGDEALWEVIYEANQAAIKNPNLIYAGQVFVIPDLTEAAVDTQSGEEEKITENAPKSMTGEIHSEEKVYSTIEEYINDPEVRAELDAGFAADSLEGFELRISAKGNELTMEIKCTENREMKGMGAILEEQLEKDEDSYKEAVAHIDEGIGQSGACTLVIRFLDFYENVLAERTFKAK